MDLVDFKKSVVPIVSKKGGLHTLREAGWHQGLRVSRGVWDFSCEFLRWSCIRRERLWPFGAWFQNQRADPQWQRGQAGALKINGIFQKNAVQFAVSFRLTLSFPCTLCPDLSRMREGFEEANFQSPRNFLSLSCLSISQTGHPEAGQKASKCRERVSSLLSLSHTWIVVYSSEL